MNKQRWVNWTLSGALLVGGVLAWQTGQESARLQAEYRRLSAITGELVIDDPAKVAIRAIETGEPLHFAWRVYIPPNYRQIVSSAQDSSESWSAASQQFIARVRFRLDEQGILRVYRRFSGGSNYSTLGDRHLGDLLKSGWDQIEAAQLGKDEVVSLAVGDPAVLLRLTLPPEMEEAAGQVLPAGLQQAFVPVLYELRLGRQAVKP